VSYGDGQSKAVAGRFNLESEMVTYESGKAPADAPVTYTTDRRYRAAKGER